MRNGWNPVRRNRNFGTAKHGHGQDNELTIPQPADTLRSFYERLIDPVVGSIAVHKKAIPVLIEKLKDGLLLLMHSI